MNPSDIRQIIELVENTTISEVRYEENHTTGKSKLIIKKMGQKKPVKFLRDSYEGSPETGEKLPDDPKDRRLVEIKSPIIGNFYRRPAPDKPNFVEIGDTVKKGQPICLIEAMKLYNDICSDVDGIVHEILIDNDNPVEYDQPMFIIDTKPNV